MNGFLLIDKPADMSSFAAVYAVRKRLDQKKAGHAGTLDPFATGLLIVALGAYTRLIPHFDDMPKTYTAVGVLGELRDTDDATGSVTETFPAITASPDAIRTLIRDRFTGAIRQLPPRYSALKVKGHRAYDLARGGDDFDLAVRDATVHTIELTGFDYPRFAVRMSVSRGTYVRTIIRDIGTALGSGAYTEVLRRTHIGPLAVGNAIAPAAVSSEAVLGYHDIFPDIPLTLASSALSERLHNGNRSLPDVPDGRHYFTDGDSVLLAITDVSKGNARYEFVNNDVKAGQLR
ncbi:MAG: tRNA pseudouridine(55) synthase TruB [Spirochaetota bacterium]